MKQALFIWQPQTYNDAVTFAKQKHHFVDTDSDTQLMDLLHEIHKEVSLKHTGIKHELYSAPIQDTHTNHLQQDIFQLQTNMQTLKEWVNTLHTQYAAPLDTNPVALQQQLFKMKEASNNCRRQNALMPTPLLLGPTEVFTPSMLWWFVNDFTKLGILHVHAQQTCQ